MKTVADPSSLYDSIAASLRTAPIAWMVSLLTPLAFVVIAWLDGPTSVSFSVWGFVPIFTVSLLLLGATLYRARRISRVGRGLWCVGAVGLGAGLCLLAHQSPDPEAYTIPAGCLATTVLLLLPLIGPADPNQGGNTDGRVWRRGVRLALRLGAVGWLIVGISSSIGLLVSLFPDEMAGVLGVFVSVILALFLGLLSLSAVVGRTVAAPEQFQARLDAVELRLVQVAFVLAALAAIGGTLALFGALAGAFGIELLSLQAALLLGISAVGPLALFLGAPFIRGDDQLRGHWLRRLGGVMRLLPASFIALVAWSSPVVVTSWSMHGWTRLEQCSTALLVVFFGYCALTAVFELQGRKLPLWVLPAAYAIGAVGLAVVMTWT